MKVVFIHDSGARHTVQSSVSVPCRFIFSLGQLRSKERFRTVETVMTVETLETVEIVDS